MTNEIQKLIRQKRRVHSKAKRFNRETDWIKFRNIRNKVISTISKASDDYQMNLVNKLKDINPSHKSWWKLCGQISGIKQTARGISPLLKNNTLIYNDTKRQMNLTISLFYKLFLMNRITLFQTLSNHIIL